MFKQAVPLMFVLELTLLSVSVALTVFCNGNVSRVHLTILWNYHLSVIFIHTS